LEPIRVAEIDDPRLALYRGVRDPDLLRAHGAFVAEGRLIVGRLLAQSRFRARSVLVTPAAHASLGSILRSAGCPVYLADSDVIQHVIGFDLHRGCLAIGDRGEPKVLDEVVASGGPLVVLEAVGNPDNIGGVFRNAAAFGASGVVLSPGCSDPLYRKSIRTSMGATLVVPFAVAPEWPATVSRLRDDGWTVVALTPAEDASDVRSVGALSDSRVALLLGHEGSGLSAEAQQLASLRARIPITSAVDSLNLASAAAIGLFAITAGRVSRPRQGSPR
jgi:tRNA G18 (ribose-2'-O)-methylase SpoU